MESRQTRTRAIVRQQGALLPPGVVAHVPLPHRYLPSDHPPTITTVRLVQLEQISESTSLSYLEARRPFPACLAILLLRVRLLVPPRRRPCL